MENIYKIGIVITAYNRPEYLNECLDSLFRSDIHDDIDVVIIDDYSDNKKTLEILDSFARKKIVTIYRNEKNNGICYSLKKGFDILLQRGCDILINLDSDSLVRNDFLDVLIKLKTDHPKNIVTGFHSINKNKDGSDRHPILLQGNGYCTKRSVGGINFCIDKYLYEKYVKPALTICYLNGGNWDHQACIASEKDGNNIVCSVPSVVQHIGFDSSMNHHEQPDIAIDFKELHLPSVTLIGIDCVNFERIEQAINKSCKNIKFGAVKILTSIENSNHNSVKINNIPSIQRYSDFIMKGLSKYIDTEYVLIIQYDGFVMNHKAWCNDFLNHDYIGATWWYKDGMNVGNGGFSLRSKKLLELTSKDHLIKQTHPEDHHICRTYRKYLEGKGIKFAHEDLAKKFSIEGHGGQDNIYVSQFGFHGKVVQFNKQKTISNKKDTLIINQPRGLGDILFSMKAIQDFIESGHKVVWPVVKEYVSIQKHFPDITFIDWQVFKMDYNRSDEYYLYEGTRVIPLRFSDSICKVKYTDCMKSKYLFFKKDWEEWKDIKYHRDKEAELYLYNKILVDNGILVGEKYNIINKHFRTEMTGIHNIVPDNAFRSINIKPEDGFTMIDWSMLLEKAEHIYTVGTSINYLIELLDIKAKYIYLYIRRPDEKDFKNYDYVLSKDKPYVFNE